MLLYTTPLATVQQVLQQHYLPSEDANQHVQKVMHRLKVCRTAALGYPLYQCTDEACSHILNTSTIAAVTATALTVEP